MIWSPEQDAKLAKWRKEKIGYADIGKRLGVTKNAACGRANFLGLMDKKKAKYQELAMDAQRGKPPVTLPVLRFMLGPGS